MLGAPMFLNFLFVSTLPLFVSLKLLHVQFVKRLRALPPPRAVYWNQEFISLGLPGDAPGMREVTPAKTLEQLARLWDVGADFDAETVRCGSTGATP